MSDDPGAGGAPVFLTSPLLASLPHGFFTRIGGISTGPFASLNCSMTSGDLTESLRENRRRVAASMGVAPERLLGVTQVHGTAVATVAEPWRPGEGPRADAMVTDRPGVALGIITADCGPVLLADAARGVIGAAHAGWRGAVAGMLEAVVAAMEALGARRDAIAAVVGPCIGQASYEVGPELRQAIADAGIVANPDKFFEQGRDDRLHFDLAGYCVARLEACGLRTVAAVGCDTRADETRFFSHRRRTLAGGGPIGHQISVIATIPEDTMVPQGAALHPEGDGRPLHP